MPHNLTSPNGIVEPVDIADLSGWFTRELAQVENPKERRVLEVVGGDLDSFVRWAKEPLLLWATCNRIAPPGVKRFIHPYPAHLRALLKTKQVVADARPNGPAINAFVLAGGERPPRFGNANGWSIHHLYSGKFPYIGRDKTTHAIKDGLHFTQSAGLVAAHPVADAMFDEFPFFAWLLRAHAFRRFGYDPDGVFASTRDDYGFEIGRVCGVVG
jgi:hypothetical protein